MLAWIEGSTLATWTRESPSLWAYPTILTLHTIGLGIVVGANAVIDFRLLGFGRRIPLSSLLPLFRVTWWAFALNAVTGVLLFMADASTKSVQVVFYIKLSLIALASSRRSRPDLSSIRANQSSVSRARSIAILSLLWAGAITAGRLSGVSLMDPSFTGWDDAGDWVNSTVWIWPARHCISSA